MTPDLALYSLPDFPLVEPGDNLVDIILNCMAKASLQFEVGDVLVIAQKIFSKAENCYVYLKDIEPSEAAISLGLEVDKDPRQMEILLRESNEIVRKRPGVVVVEHRNGYVHANAGMDKSNIESDPDNPRILLLPKNPDSSAQTMMDTLKEKTGIKIPIIINDSAGRAWRNGTAGFALGTAGFEPLENRIGEADLFGRELEVTEVAVADELAAAGSFIMGQGAEAAPVVLVRGATLRPFNGGSTSLIRPKERDMFR